MVAMPIILVRLTQKAMMIRQTGWKAIFFICNANHQSWLWFPPEDLFVMVVVVSRTSSCLVWSPMTCPVKGSTGKGFLLLLTKLALSTSPTKLMEQLLASFPTSGLTSEQLWQE